MVQTFPSLRKTTRSLLLLGSLILLLLFPSLVHAQSTSYNCDTQTAIPAQECVALVTLYSATGGQNWVHQTGWLIDENPCNWYGVSCVEGHVSALDLFSNNLTGELPLEIGNLGELKTLTLNSNALTGELPLTITYLELDLFHFHDTSICEPSDPGFQDWFSQIVFRLSSGISCDAARLTPNANPTATLAPANELPWPQQTLTALAIEAANPGFTPQVTNPTPTRVSPAATNTPIAVMEQEEFTSEDGLSGGMPETVQKGAEPGGFFSQIPFYWLLLLGIPLLLIVLGIGFELRDRRKEKRAADKAFDYSQYDQPLSEDSEEDTGSNDDFSERLKYFEDYDDLD